MQCCFCFCFLFFIVIAPDGRLDNLHVQTDPEPLRVVKPADQGVHYKQQVNVRFLEPPPAPEPAPIIIKVLNKTERKICKYSKNNLSYLL